MLPIYLVFLMLLAIYVAVVEEVDANRRRLITSAAATAKSAKGAKAAPKIVSTANAPIKATNQNTNGHLKNHALAVGPLCQRLSRQEPF